MIYFVLFLQSDKSKKIEITKVKDIDDHINNIVNEMKVHGVTVSCRKFDAKGEVAFQFPLCSHSIKDFTQLDESRKIVLRNIDKQWNLKLGISESKEHDDFKQDQLTGILGGAGTGKSHFLDYLANKVVKSEELTKKYFLMSITFNDPLKIEERDYALIGNKQYIGVMLLRFLFIYYVILAPKDSKVSVTDEQMKKAFQLFSIILTKDYSINYGYLWYDFEYLFEKVGKKMFLILDDISLIGDKQEMQVVDAIKGHCGPIIFSSFQSRKSIPTKYKPNYFNIDPISLTDMLTTSLQKNHGIKLANTGKFLLSMLGKHTRSYGVFFNCIVNDSHFRKLCENTKPNQLKETLKEYIEAWKYRSFGTTRNVTSLYNEDSEHAFAYTALVCIYLIGLEHRKCSIEFKFDEISAFTHFRDNGLVDEGKKGLLVISPLILYMWADTISRDSTPILDLLPQTVANIANTLKKIFDIVCGEWSGSSVESLVGHLILLRLNCLKFLFENQITKNRRIFSLGNVLRHGQHRYSFMQTQSKEESKQESKLQEDTLIPDKERTSLLDFGLIDDECIADIVEQPQRNFFKMTKKEGTEDTSEEEREHVKVSMKKVLNSRNKPQPGIYAFKSNNPSFDYLIVLPLCIFGKRGNKKVVWEFIFIEVKSRGDWEYQLKFGYDYSKLNQGGEPKEFEKQFEDWQRYMVPNSTQPGFFAKNNAYWLLCCDFKLTQVHKKFDSIEQASFTLTSEDFGIFLKNFVYEREIWSKQSGKIEPKKN